MEQNIFTTAKKYEYEKYSEALEVMLWMTLEYLNKKNIKNQNKINIQVNEAKPKTKKNLLPIIQRMDGQELCVTCGSCSPGSPVNGGWTKWSRATSCSVSKIR